MRGPVYLWTRPADRHEPYGPYGQAVDDIPVAHRLPTLSRLATTGYTGSKCK